jgi:putative intracellular protease/amidase
MNAIHRILIIVTNHDEFDKAGFRTGLWLSELTHFWETAEEAGCQMDIASPSGGKVPIDPESLMIPQIAGAVGLKGDLSKRYEDKFFMELLHNTLKVSDLDSAGYDAIYMAGGHGVMFDFPQNRELATLTAGFYKSGKVVSAVCHGPCGLLDVKLDNGNYLIAGKKLTGFSWNEEIIAKRDQAVPFNLEEELKRRGARYSKALLPFNSHVVEDGLLITGQNPGSAHALGQAVVRKVEQAVRA